VRLRAAIAAACVVGAAIAAYLTYVHYAHTAPICTTGGCETVQKSKYAELGGVPVALLGLITYVVLFALAFVRGVTGALAGVFVALVGIAFSGYLLWAQLGPIGSLPVVPGNDSHRRRCGVVRGEDADRAHRMTRRGALLFARCA
jgi:uncharacterized membrane protein